MIVFSMRNSELWNTVNKYLFIVGCRWMKALFCDEYMSHSFFLIGEIFSGIPHKRYEQVKSSGDVLRQNQLIHSNKPR